MQTAEERCELSRQFEGEQLNALTAALKRAAGILMLVAVAVSPWLVLNSDVAKMAAEQPAFQAARAFPSVAESRRIFEERRQRHEARLSSSTPQARDAAATGAEAKAGNLARNESGEHHADMGCREASIHCDGPRRIAAPLAP